MLKKRPWHRYFPVNFSKFPRTPFLQNTSGGCFCSLVGQDLSLVSLRINILKICLSIVWQIFMSILSTKQHSKTYLKLEVTVTKFNPLTSNVSIYRNQLIDLHNTPIDWLLDEGNIGRWWEFDTNGADKNTQSRQMQRRTYQSSMIELSCDNNEHILFVNYFLKKGPSKILWTGS